MDASTITLRVSAVEKDIISGYAHTFGVTVSEFMRRAALERIEDELDLQAWHEAKAEYEADPRTYSAAEIEAMYL